MAVRLAESCSVIADTSCLPVRSGHFLAEDVYVPKDPEADEGFVAFLSSAQNVLVIAVVVVAAILCAWVAWSERRYRAENAVSAATDAPKQSPPN